MPTNRTLLGKLGTTEYGLRVSKPGVDVLTAAASDLLIDTAYGYGRTLQYGMLTIPAGAAGTSVSALFSPIGTGVPVVIFRYGEVYNGSSYVFPMYRNEDNTTSTYGPEVGWTAIATSNQVIVTRNFAYDLTSYVYYFILTMEV